MIHDVVLARQVEDWKVIGAALLELKEEMEAQDRVHMKSVYEDLYSLENRYIEVMEENNRHIQTMLSR
jgi:argininosuccinate lyase